MQLLTNHILEDYCTYSPFFPLGDCYERSELSQARGTAPCVAWPRIMSSVLSTLTPATCEQRPHLLWNVHNCKNTTASLPQTEPSSLPQTEQASLPQTEPASLLQTEPASLLQTEPAPCRAADAVAREAQRQQRLAARREAARQRAAARRQLRREQQAAAADALQQQVDEYLASFDPEKPLYQDGWAMGKMQENFQQKLRSMRNLCCVVCSERWYMDGECSDPTLYV